MSQDENTVPPQHQDQQPGLETEMTPAPAFEGAAYRGSGKLTGKVALITGGDSGIGRAVAVHYAKEGADVAIVYLNEDEDAEETKRQVEQEGRRCLTIAGNVGDESFCQKAVEQTVAELGHLNVLVNNAAEQLERTFRTNIFGMFFMTKAVLKHLHEGSTIVNSCSVTAFRGSGSLLDYAATKGAIVAFTRSLAQQLAEKKIRVNSVAPGPVWTPLIPSTFSEEKVASFGQDVLMKRPGQPEEIAPSYVFLASSDGSFFTGQTLHPNGGDIVGS